MKILMMIAAVLLVTNIKAQSMRMHPMVFEVEMHVKQFGITSSTNTTQSTYIHQTSNANTGFANENAAPKITIAENPDNSTSNIVVQEDLVAGKKGEGLNIFKKFYRKFFSVNPN